MASQFGELFRVTTFGESHGEAVGCVIDGCPAGLALDLGRIQAFLARRKPGQNAFTTPRKEDDTAEFLSGLTPTGVTLGSPICISVRNANQRSQDYTDISRVFRPSHADYTTVVKYGLREAAGGGRSSARETIGRVAAAAVAQQFLESLCPGIEVVAYVARVADIAAKVDSSTVSLADVEASPVRCPESAACARMRERILEVKEAGDTIGGLVGCVIRNMPAGLGEPVFDKLEADLAKAMLSLPATKSFEVGSGLAGTFLKGSEHNDAFATDSQGNVTTLSNKSGGIQGGISNGMPVIFSVGFKPVSTLFLEQKTVTVEGHLPTTFKPQAGRHDSCVLPRAVPMVEAMSWLVIADHALRQIALSQGRWPSSLKTFKNSEAPCATNEATRHAES